MSTPDKPETPAHEIMAQQFQAKLGKQGSNIVRKVGDKFIANSKRDRTTRARGSASADVAMATREMQKAASPKNAAKHAKATSSVATVTGKEVQAKGGSGVASKGSALTSGAVKAVGQSSAVTSGAMQIASIDNSRNMDAMRRKFATANSLIDGVGAVSGVAYGAYSESQGVAEHIAEKEKIVGKIGSTSLSSPIKF